MPFPLHQRLLNEAIEHGVGEILRQMPAAYSQEMEQSLRQGIRQAVLFYTHGVDTWSKRLHPLDPGQQARA